ncbi:protein RKD4-like [Lotus japonicus]|uniref:protein RKD4-like n=1 Tax=Lotus japonicus TaxID=34305 RepID=UPI002585DCB1|nr:protein RKD4-like [Lotus japonicus]
MDISPLESSFELPYQQNNQRRFSDEFDDFENFSHHFNLPADRVHCNGSGGSEGNASSSRTKKEKEEEEKKEEEEEEKPSSSSRRRKSTSSPVLELEEIKKHFGLKITEAAKEMNVGLTLLKKRCRELNIMRWPHRQLQSLKSVIDNVKELGLEDELAKLEEQKRMLERTPGMKLSEKTMKLRQSCYKTNYNRRRRKQNTIGKDSSLGS